MTGHELDVATALTSLALFDILRFPLFMLPNVINNLVEAKVSVDRIQRFLLAGEKQLVTEGNLVDPGVFIRKGTFVWKCGI
jgi:ATP-binding cassette subfamily C (CFTR/MRP) protein 1